MPLHSRGRSPSYVKVVCLKQPSLLAFQYTSQVQTAKWEFSTCVLQHSPAFMAACPHLLMFLPLAPCWENLQCIIPYRVIFFSAAQQVVVKLVARTDSVSRARYSPPKSAALGLFDLHF
ncbi:TPA: hypothetical protein ACH3X1_013538 [Trebouxia sp. C0004]